MNSLWLRLKSWQYISIVLGVPLCLLLIIGVPILFFVGVESPIWNIVSIAVSTLTVMSLVILNLLTIFMMKAQLQAQITPSIIAYFDNPLSSLIDLVVKNIGNGAAREVLLRIDPPLLDHKNRDISELSLFKRGIEFFPPNREFRQIVGTSDQFFGEDFKRPLEYELTISYKDIERNPAPDQTIHLDLSVYRDLPIHRESDIAKAIMEMVSTIKATRGGV